jgi:hypothetical protein
VIGALENEIEALTRLDLHQLRDRWCRQFGRPPRFRSTELFRLMLAWRIQATALGGLDRDIRKALARSGPVEAEGLQLGPGATLRRQWQGREVIVEVVEGGFRYDRRTFKSLSAVASAITGAKWNGPRFFGLRTL